jgi:hypothetical protein
MKKTILLLVVFQFIIGYGQNNSVVRPNEIKHPVGFAITPSLRDKPVVTDFRLDNSEFRFNKHIDRQINPNIHPPTDFDAIYNGQFDNQRAPLTTVSPNVTRNFAGQDTGSYPPDTNGAVNENYYFQVVNTTYAIYDKNGNLLAGPTDLNEIFDSSLPGANCNNGDPIVLWDEQANKWFYAEFSLCNNNDYMLIAVSQTDDPTGAWWSWSFDVDDSPDYMKFGIWQDGYYMATNTGNGNDVYVFERDVMINGGSNPTMIGFDNPNRPDTFDGFHCILPMDNDGAWAPNGTPGQFITIVDDDQNNPADELWIYRLEADWSSPGNSSFQRTQTLSVSSFTGNFSNDWENIPQPGTSQKLDAISTVLMYRACYRNFGGDQRLVVTHTIAESATEGAIRWYELQNTGNGWAIRQEGNVNPDNISRWNAAIAINARKEIGMGFSISDGNNTYPGIRVIGQTADENANANGVFDVEETVILDGQYAQTNLERWGDYCNISVDPSDDRTFWFTTEYNKSNTHGTRIVSFVYPDTCTPPDTQASNFQASTQSETQIDLSWTRGNGDNVIILAKQGGNVDADPENGTNYNADNNFGNGDEIGNGNYVVYVGNDTSVSITGLSSATTYYFAVYEFNNTDVCYLTPGETVSATTNGLPSVTTLPMLQVNDYDAQGQGEVVSENGSAVTERGLCWSTNPNPTIADDHASNGTGTGTYTVDITGLNINTTYYVRAYAINATGTAYGDNVSFSTGCNLITDYPYLETFNLWANSNPTTNCTADESVGFSDCWQNLAGDDSDWDIIDGATATSATGPADDANGGGKYIYLEASNCTNKTASVLTPHFDFTNVANPYLTFFTYMYGADMGELQVYYTTDDGQNWNLLGTLSGEIGDYWVKIIGDLSSLSGEADVQFKFTGVTGNGELSDIAIDNFSLKDYTPTTYCTSEGNMDYDTAVTAVIFNQINNVSGGKTHPYEDYTNVMTEVQRGQSYDLTVRVDTDGNYQVYSYVWIDWNQDGDFDDAGEEYDLGSAVNQDDGATSASPLSITVPNDAVFGQTRMRVSAKYNNSATACETGYDGEVEDYSVVVINDCSAVAFWNGAVWYDVNYNLLDQNTDLSDKFLIINDVLVTEGNDIDACGMLVKSSNSVTINSGDYIKLLNDVYNYGSIDIQNNGMLAQTSDTGIVTGDGTYKFQRITQDLPDQYSYVYWSAPIQNISLGNIVSDAWGYYSFDASVQDWSAETSNTIMQAGKAYAVSAPNNHNGGVLDVNFNHQNTAFNYGSISTNLDVVGTGAQDDDDWNLVGNPYPSPIDFNELVNQNANIEGAYYLWTNCAGLDANGQHQTIGYTIYSTGSGSTAACNGSGVSATRYIPAAQGFFVEANTAGNLVFENSQRVVNNTPFVNRITYDRLWLNFSNNIHFNQNLIGFFAGATDQRDRLFDARTIDYSTFALYTFINNEKYSIQGLSEWNGNDRVIPLGFVTRTAGLHTISIQQTQGVLDLNVNIYLEDLYNNTLVDLKSTDYEFQTTQGAFDDRFRLIFTENTLQTDEFKKQKHINLLENCGVFELISDRKNLKKVEIYAINGKNLLTYRTKKPEERISMNLHSIPHQVLIFKVYFTDGTVNTIKGIR